MCVCVCMSHLYSTVYMHTVHVVHINVQCLCTSHMYSSQNISSVSRSEWVCVRKRHRERESERDRLYVSVFLRVSVC